MMIFIHILYLILASRVKIIESNQPDATYSPIYVLYNACNRCVVPDKLPALDNHNRSFSVFYAQYK